MIDYKSENLKFKVADFSLSFPTTVSFETFNDPENYYGIIFFHKKYKYEVLECRLGSRIIINGDMGECKDMPFNMGTAEFLPEFIKVKKIN